MRQDRRQLSIEAMRRAMDDKNMSLRSIASRLAVHPVTVNKWIHNRSLSAEKVFELARVLGVSAESLVAAQPPSEVTAREQPNRKLRVFLCHSKGDKRSVRRLYHRLKKEGFDPWLDEAKLLPGQEWDAEIRRAVRESDAVIVCLSKASITKEGYVQKEIKYALDLADEKPAGTIFIIPARLEECNVPEHLLRWQWIDLKKNGFPMLVAALLARATSLQKG